MEAGEENRCRAGVVVLHYLVDEMTARCVDALLACQDAVDLSIVVVDNGSGNGSGERLARRYARNPLVDVIFTGDNLGFARGNNAGYRFLRARGGFDLIAVLNNDVLIDQADFFECAHSIVREHPCAVLGPDIVSGATQEHQSPVSATHPSVWQLRNSRYVYQRFLRTGKEPMWEWRWRRTPMALMQRAINRCGRRLFGYADHKHPTWGEPHDGAVLHGACYLFTREFIEVRENAFNPETFLYLEEEILHFECERDGLAMRYDPCLAVLHLEDVATDASLGEDRTVRLSCGVEVDAKDVLKRTELCKSIDVLLGLMRA